MVTFKSDVDRWYYMVIAGSVLAIVGVVMPTYMRGQMPLLEAGLLTLVLSLPIVLYFSTYYRVSADELFVRTGIFTWTVPLAEIHSARPSRSLLSSPALSLNRIEITYGRQQKLLVSPNQQQAFLQAIGQ